MSQPSDSPSLGDPPSETGETIPTEAEASQPGAGSAPQRAAAGTLPPDRPVVGRVLGRFRVVQELAAGGLGEVYRAEQEILGRDAVIKVMRRDRTVTPARAERFLREARLAARLDHPYAAHVYAFGAEPDGLLWIAMELVRGQTVRDLVRQRGPMPPALFAPLAVALCEVVHAAHELGIVHRDLKPANVMVMASGGRLLPKLIDFGVAKGLDDAELPAGRASSPASVELTREDQALGSPHYMAPEQWASPGAVDRRADVFALGAVFYYMLSGQPPFRGNTADELARARIETVPAPVGGGAPGALDAVLAHALASSPARRFPTALELASALTAAVAASAATPSLNPLLVETWSARAPEPLAELVFALSAARTETEADALARTLVEALCRWLAVLALAEQRGHDGAPPERARQLGRGLLARGLSAAGWLELAQVLVAAGASSASGAVAGGATAGRRASGSADGSSEYTPSSGTWPPARAALDSSPLDRLPLLPPDGIRALGEFLGGAGAAALAELASPRDPLPAGASLHSRLSADMARLGAVLAQLGAMLDTALVADVDGQPLELSGLRRRRQASLWGPPLAPGELALIGAGGAARLTLSPLVVLAPAVPGGDPEVFMLAGGPRGPCLRALPSGAEISGGEAVRQVADALDLTASQVETGESGEDAPYRGLAPFSAGDAARFVGRAREAETFINLLRARRLVGLVGASGAGKSSFLQAGVLAALPEGWTHVSLRPGATPVRALLAAAGLDLPASAAAEAIAGALVAGAPASGALVVAVDQMEELFALGAPAEERERFAAALVAAADGAGGRVRVVLCLRDDFLARAEALGPLRGRLASALTVLVTPAPAELRRIVLEPAERAGYWFEDEAVVDEMVATIADRPGGLALLSFAVLAWWERRDRERHLLPTAAYRRLGGVAGALASHADALYAGMPASAQRAARDIIRQLVTAEGTRAALPAADLVRLAGPGGEQALDGLIAGRLLVARDDVDGDAIELAHESLIEVWPLLRRIREEDAADAGLRDDLRAAARGWSQRQRSDDELWRGRALAELERFRARAGVRLTSLEEEFADASRAIGRRTRRRRRALIFAAIGATAAASVVLGLAERDARHSEARARTLAEQARRGEAEAEIRLAKTWAIEGQRESARGSPLRALAYLLPAYGRVDGSGTRFAIARAMASIDEERAVLRGHRSSIHSIEWSHDGRTLATVNEEAATRLWRFDRGRVEPIDIGDARGMFLGFSAGDKIYGLGDVKDGSIVLRTVADHKEVARIGRLASKETNLDGHFSDGGGSLLLFRSDGMLWVYGADGKLRKRAATGLKIDFAAADRSGRRVFLAGETGGLHMWDMKRGKGREVLPVSFGGLAMSDRGDVVVAGGADGNTYVIDGVKGARRHVLASHPGRHYTAVSRDGRWIASGGYDRTAKLWHAATGKLLATLHEHRGPVSVVAFDPSGQLLATASGDGTVRIYNTRGAMLAAYEGHTADILDLAWSPDGQWLASGAADGLVAVWPGRSPQTREISGGNQELAQIEVCGELAMLSFDKGLALHDIASGKLVRRIPLDEPPFSVACSAERIAVGTLDGVRLFSLDGKQVSRERGAEQPISVIGFSGDGRAMATISYDQTVRMWDGITGKPGKILVGSPEDPSHASSLDFSADGKSLFVGDSTGQVTVWSTGGEMLRRRKIHNQEVIWLAVSRDGARLAAASADRSLSIAKAGDLVPERTIEEHVAFVTSIDWSADSKLLLTGSEDTSAFVWDVDTGALVGEIRPGRGAVAGAIFAGDKIVAGSRGGRVMTFPASLERRSPEEIRRILHCRLPYRLGSAGRIQRVTPPEGCR